METGHLDAERKTSMESCAWKNWASKSALDPGLTGKARISTPRDPALARTIIGFDVKSASTPGPEVNFRAVTSPTLAYLHEVPASCDIYIYLVIVVVRDKL